jgi:putative copper resistance protein D
MDVEWLFIAIRTVLYIDLMAMFGLALFGLNGLQSAERAVRVLPLWSLIATMALLGLAASIMQIVAMAASMAGVPITSVSVELLGKLVNGTVIGAAWKVRMAALLAMVPISFLMARTPRAALMSETVLGGVAVATFAWAGHGAMNSGAIGWVHLGADVVHLFAAGAWIGAITALCILLVDGRPALDAERISLLSRALSDFSSTGTVIVGLILLTGIANVWIIVGVPNVLSLPDHTYGRLLLAKIALFIAMLCSHQHGYPRTALAMLRVSLAAEAGCALTILAVAAWLGTLAPSG